MCHGLWTGYNEVQTPPIKIYTHIFRTIMHTLALEEENEKKNLPLWPICRQLLWMGSASPCHLEQLISATPNPPPRNIRSMSHIFAHFWGGRGSESYSLKNTVYKYGIFTQFRDQTPARTHIYLYSKYL